MSKVIKNKAKRKETSVIFNVSATFNNTIVTFAATDGSVIAWSSAGKCKFKGPKKSTPHAASVITNDAIKSLMEKCSSVGSVTVILKGPGSGRESAVRALHAAGLKIAVLKDATSLPNNGCRAPKRRRV